MKIIQKLQKIKKSIDTKPYKTGLEVTDTVVYIVVNNALVLSVK